MNFQSICGVILSGGGSTRIGQDKAWLKYKGKYLIAHQINLLEYFFKNLVISTNNNSLKQFGYTVIHDEFLETGPIGGIHAVIKNTNFDYYYFLAVDLPCITQSIIDDIINNSAKGNIVIPKHGKFIEPLCGIYHRKILSRIEKTISRGNYKLMDIIKNENTYFIEMNDRSENFKNLNFMTDFEQ